MEIYLNRFKNKNYLSLKFKYNTEILNTVKNSGDISTEDIKQYLLYLIEGKKYSHSSQNQAINAIKFYFEKVLKKEKVFYI